MTGEWGRSEINENEKQQVWTGNETRKRSVRTKEKLKSMKQCRVRNTGKAYDIINMHSNVEECFPCLLK